MRKKEMRLIVTFHTTTDAMAMEKLCKQNSISGRLIPVPGSVSAGCGMCWCTNLQEKEKICNFLETKDLKVQTILECMI